MVAGVQTNQDSCLSLPVSLLQPRDNSPVQILFQKPLRKRVTLSCSDTVVTMDPFEHLRDAPNLNGDVKILSPAPVFTGTYSRVYRGQLQPNGQLVCFFWTLGLLRRTT